MSATDQAGTIKVFGSLAVADVMGEFLPQFERASGFRVSGTFEPSKAIMDRLRAGETGDLVMVLPGALDELQAIGAIDPASRVKVVRTGVAIAVKAGAQRPDIGTAEALKQTLLAAQSLAYTLHGASGMHFATVVERLGLTDALRARTTRVDHPVRAGDLVAKGEAEIGVQQWSELAAIPGIDIIGFLPGELASSVTIEAAIFAGSANATGGRAFIAFLRDPARAPAFAKLGLFQV